MAKVGDIFVTTWGYDQTNANFFQVVGVTAKSVKVREIRSKITESSPQSMTGHAMPIKNAFKGSAMTKRIYQGYDGERINIGDSMGSAGLWDGSPVAISWYG